MLKFYRGPTFLDYVEGLPSFARQSEGPVRIPVVDRYKDMGTIALGKVESGQVYIGQKLVLMPNRVSINWLLLIAAIITLQLFYIRVGTHINMWMK